MAGFSSGFAGKESVGENLAIPSCRYTSETITLDGKLAEDAWHRAQPLSFHVPVSHARPRTKTIGRLCWDEKYFYVAFEAEDADLRAERTERDSEVYRDDVFEVFFLPDGPDGRRFNIEVNALGAYYDGDSRDHLRWNCEGLRTGIDRRGTLNDSSDRDQGWSMEIAIPFASLDLPETAHPRDRATWLFHLARYDWSKDFEEEKELSSTARLTRVNFHNPPDWRRFVFLREEEPAK